MSRLIVDTWFATHSRHVSHEVLQRRREGWGYAESECGWRRAIRDAESSPNLILVAVEQDQIIGVAASEAASPGRAEVGALYVDPAHQRRGVGRELLQAIADHYRGRGVHRLCLAVLTGNGEARRFYDRQGGHVIECRDHEDGPQVVYQWDLRKELSS